MADEHSYTIAEIEQVIEQNSQLFDVVRLVDPISMTVYRIEDGKLVGQPGGCYNVWHKSDRCENCVSSRCLMDHARYSKFEFIDKDIYHVVAQPVVVDGRKFVLEVVTESDDNVLLTAFGNNDFVNRITEYNHKVYTDELTGLSNRRYLNERLELMATRAAHDKASIAVVMIDIDDFKDINDLQGHLAGDEALRQVGGTLTQGFRPGDEDLLARYGGDEFFCALWDIDHDDLEGRLKAVQQLADESGLGVTLSMGALFEPVAHEATADELIKAADRIMYGIKAAGKNNYAIEDGA